MPDHFVVFLVALPCIFAIWLKLVFMAYLESNPFQFPYFERDFDISGKRNVYMNDLIDEFLSQSRNWNALLSHEERVYQWECDCEDYIRMHHFKKTRRRQFEEAKDYEHAYVFRCIRQQTRYKQENYQKYAYSVDNVVEERSYNFNWLYERHEKLKKIGYETSLSQYYAKDQRRLMTRALRKQIMERDNYTCQICGKYMPDEVGLQIDHIIPVSRGGKTLPSNLRVLCNKCNGHKGNRRDEELE